MVKLGAAAADAETVVTRGHWRRLGMQVWGTRIPPGLVLVWVGETVLRDRPWAGLTSKVSCF